MRNKTKQKKRKRKGTIQRRVVLSHLYPSPRHQSIIKSSNLVVVVQITQVHKYNNIESTNERVNE